MFASSLGDRNSIPVELYQRLKKWYLMPRWLALSTIRYGSRVKWSNLVKGVVPSPTPYCSSYWKGSLWVAPDYGRQLYFYIIFLLDFFTLVLACDLSLESEWQQVFRSHLSILSNSNSTVVKMVSILPLISSFNCLLSNPFGNVPRAPASVCVTITFMFYSLFTSSKYNNYFSWCVFFTPILTSGLSLESGWQKVSSDLWDSSEYSSRSW